MSEQEQMPETGQTDPETTQPGDVEADPAVAGGGGGPKRPETDLP